jgi:hypothetical protein
VYQHHKEAYTDDFAGDCTRHLKGIFSSGIENTRYSVSTLMAVSCKLFGQPTASCFNTFWATRINHVKDKSAGYKMISFSMPATFTFQAVQDHVLKTHKQTFRRQEFTHYSPYSGYVFRLGTAIFRQSIILRLNEVMFTLPFLEL